MSELKSSNVWDYKPWWCQPWSILLTGVVLVGGSWLLLRIIWISVGTGILVIVWWGYFLVLFPRAFRQYLESSDKHGM